MNKLALQLILALAMGLCGAFAESAVSPDGRYIVFVKTASGPTIGWGAGEEQPGELWQTDADGGNPVLLCRSHSDDDMREVVAAFKDLRFSSDGRRIHRGGGGENVQC